MTVRTSKRLAPLIFLFLIGCGGGSTPAARTASSASNGDLPSTPSESSVANELFDSIRRERANAQKQPLGLNTNLAEVALAHSKDMADHAFVGHISPRTGNPVDRLHRSGYRSGLVLENVGNGPSSAEIHEALMQSPGHRANILNPDVTHVGIGVVKTTTPQGSVFWVTEIFAQMAGAIDLHAAPNTLLSWINEARKARGAPPLESQANLERAATTAANHYFSDPTLTQQDAVDQATTELRAFSIAFKRIGGVMTVVSSLRDASRIESTLDPGVRVIGIGIAQGTRPDSATNAIAIVMMLAWPR